MDTPDDCGAPLPNPRDTVNTESPLRRWNGASARTIAPMDNETAPVRLPAFGSLLGAISRETLIDAGLVEHRPSWEDVERESRHDPWLRALVTHVRNGTPREAALISTVIALSKALRETQAGLVDALGRLPARRLDDTP